MVSGIAVSGAPRFPRGKVAVMIESSGDKHLRSWKRLGWISLKRETIVLRALQPLQDLASTHGGEGI
jgi:hypothetical protein